MRRQEEGIWDQLSRIREDGRWADLAGRKKGPKAFSGGGRRGC